MFYENLKKHKIILASRSPRRQYLFKEIGIDFEVRIKKDSDESYPPDLKSEQIVLYLAKHKSDVYKIISNELLITADTIVWLDDKVINKPTGPNDAINMLKSLSGKKHEVYTGVCLRSLQKTITFFERTDVYFKSLTEEEIQYYINNFKPFDKAGAYGIQEWIGYIGIEKIEGSYFNVMGLPIQMLYKELSRF